MYALIILGIALILLPICFLFTRKNIRRSGKEVEAVVVKNVLFSTAGETNASYARRLQRAERYLADFYAGTQEKGIIRSPGTFMPVFQYHADGHTIEATLRESMWPPRYKEGDIERILYDRRDYSKIILASDEIPYTGIYLMIALGFVFFMFGSLPLLLGRLLLLF